MPLREYSCDQCGFTSERLEYSIQAGPNCPRCEQEHNQLVEMIRQPAAPAIQFVGTGWCRPSTWTGKPERGKGPTS